MKKPIHRHSLAVWCPSSRPVAPCSRCRNADAPVFLFNPLRRVCGWCADVLTGRLPR